jgi:hypothetical protein
LKAFEGNAKLKRLPAETMLDTRRQARSHGPPFLWRRIVSNRELILKKLRTYIVLLLTKHAKDVDKI